MADIKFANAWKRYCDRVIVTGGATPLGGDAVLGGLASTKDYHAGPVSVAKEHLVRDIAHDLAEKLKIPGLNPKGKSLDDIIAQLKTVVPDPRPGKGNKKTWSPIATKQENACKIIGEIINHRMGAEMINLSQGHGAICEDAAEFVDQMLHGLHAEFAGVRKDAERILKNISVLQKVLERNYSALVTKISEDKDLDSNVKAETAVIRQAHEDIETELKRQVGMLQNMLNVVIEPTAQDLGVLLKDTKDLKNLVRKIKSAPGDEKNRFGEKIAYVLTGIRNTAQAAKLVDEALKRLGVSYNEYERAHTGKDLVSLLSQKVQMALDKPEGVLSKYLKAVEAVKKYHYIHDDIVKTLKHGSKAFKRHGAAEGCSGANEGYTGAAEGAADLHKGGLKLDKRVRRRQDVRRGLLRAFTQRLGLLLDQILKSAQGIADGIGAGKINVSDKMEKFSKALELLPDIAQKNIYFALSGFYDDIRSREEREKYISAAKYVMSTIDDVVKEGGQYSASFRDMRSGLDNVIRLINDYNGKYREGFGIIDPYADKQREKRGGLDQAAKPSESAMKKAAEMAKEALESTAVVAKAVSEAASNVVEKINKPKEGRDEECDDCFEGGVEGSADGGMVDMIMPEVTRMGYTLDRTRDVINYNFRTSRIRQNLNKFSSEMQAYGEDYVKILADAIANSVDGVMRDKREYSTNVDRTTEPRHLLRQELIPDEADSSNASRLGRAKYERIVGFQKKLYDVKISMYRIAEAVDLYLKAFADGIAAHPDQLRDIKRVLDNTEVISRWFINTSGDMLCNVYDNFPSFYEGHRAKYSSELVNETRGHYYERVRDICLLGPAPAGGRVSTKTSDPIVAGAGYGLPGNPYLGASIEKIMGTEDGDRKSAVAFAQKALDISVLKNIISVFVNIGNEFGGKDLSKSTHMPPIQLYHNLMEYIKYSSFCSGQSGLAIFNLNVNNVRSLEDLGMLLRGQGISGNMTANMAGNFGGLAGGAYGPATTLPNPSTMRIGLTGHPAGGFARALPVPGAVLPPGAPVPPPAPPMAPMPAIVAPGDGDSEVVRRFSYTALRSVRPEVGAVFNDMFKETDELFTMVIKGIVAKILTAIGVYNMFNRPINANGLGYFSGLRLILGGAADAVPKIMPEALELYVRLPLLAEWYRRIFNFSDGVLSNEDAFRKISLIPEMEGTFSGLISLIFDKAAYVSDGGYSETDVRLMVEEVNKIFLKFRASKNPVLDALQEFAAEVNRRYGVIKREERIRYVQERRDRYKGRYVDPEELTDFEIQGIDEHDRFVRPAPSQSYQTEGSSVDLKSHKYKLDLANDQRDIAELRGAIDAEFTHAQGQIGTLDKIRNTITLTHMLKARAEELKYAKTDLERFQIVRSAINGLGQYAAPALEKSFMLFHEAVMAPLNVLHALYLTLKRFHGKVSSMASAIQTTRDWLDNTTLAHQLGGGANESDLLWSIRQAGDNYRAHREDVAAWINGVNMTDSCAERGRQGVPLNSPSELLMGHLNNLLTVHLRGAAAGDATRIKNFVHRYILNQKDMFRTLFECIFAHAKTMDKMVDMRVEITRNGPDSEACVLAVHMDHSKLYKYVEDTFHAVKQSLDRFRGLLPNAVIEKYEKSSNPGSVYWLEKNFMDEFISGKLESDVSGKDTLDRVNRRIETILKYFGKGWDCNARGVIVAAAPLYTTALPQPTIQQLDRTGNAYAAVVAGQTKSFHEFDRELLELVLADPSVGIASPVRPMTFEHIHYPLANQSGRKKGAIDPGNAWTDVAPGTRAVALYDETNGFMPTDTLRGAVVTFNRLVAAYLSQVFDAGAKKFYLTALNEFANGAFSAAVMGNATLDDMVALTVSNKTPNVLCKTLALTIRHLLTDTNATGDKKLFAESDLNEIPLYVKENYKANLPIFHTLFALLIKRCEWIKDIARAFNIAQYTDITIGGVVRAPALGKSGIETSITGTVDQIIQGCISLLQCIKNTTAELSDDPKYMELSQNFISEYEGSTGMAPLMPASSTLYYLRNLSFVPIDAEMNEANYALPIYKMGDARFKVHYGTRKVFHADFTLDDMPGLKNLVKDHNQSTDAKFHFDDKLISQSVINAVQLVKYISNARHYHGLMVNVVQGAPVALNSFYDHAHGDLVTTPGVPIAIATPLLQNDPVNTVVYSLTKPKSEDHPVKLADVVRLTESTNQKEQRRLIVALVDDRDVCSIPNDRRAIATYNIIDMNFVPINIHALRREIPLANLMNYAWTFDKLACEVYGLNPLEDMQPPHSEYMLRMGDKCSRTGKALLGCLTIRPFVHMEDAVYDNRFSQIIRGDLGVEGLGQPKYLGQELYNKALFGEMYPGQVYRRETFRNADGSVRYTEEEPSPAEGNAHLRGKREVLRDAQSTPISGALYRDIVTTAARAILGDRLALPAGGAVATGFGRVPAAVVNAAIDAAVNGALSPAGVSQLGTPALATAPALAALRAAVAAAAQVANGGAALNNNQDHVVDLTAAVVLALCGSEFRRRVEDAFRRNPGRASVTSLPNEVIAALGSVDQILTGVALGAANVSSPSAAAAVPPGLPGLAPGGTTAALDSYAIEVTNALLRVRNHTINLINAPRPLNMPALDNAITAMAPIVQQAWHELPNRRGIENSNPRYFPGSLHYMVPNGDVAEVDVGTAKNYLQRLGHLRFDTILCRKIFWLTNIQRLLRLKLRRDLMWYDSKVVGNHAVLSSGITELYGNDTNPDRVRLGEYSY